MPEEPRLQALRVPMHWRIAFNDFREVDPSSDVESMKYLVEDLFQAKCERHDILVDLGWLPEEDPNGRFRLQVYRGDFRGEQLLDVSARTRADAVRLLEEALWRFHVG